MQASELVIKVRVETPIDDFRFRSNWRGKLILQRGYENHSSADASGYGYSETRWRDATVGDLQYFFIAKELSKC
jgi:hypothetical protein